MPRTLDNTLRLYPNAAYPANTTAQVMNIIMHEREVELAGEQHRYNDLRRWGLDDDVATAGIISHTLIGMHCGPFRCRNWRPTQ